MSNGEPSNSADRNEIETGVMDRIITNDCEIMAEETVKEENHNHDDGGDRPTGISTSTNPNGPLSAAEAKKALHEENMARARATVNSILEHWSVVLLMSVYTLWALFNDDIKLAATTKHADLAFEVVITIGFFLFVLEILAQCFCKPDYFRFRDWPERPDDTTWTMWKRRMRMGSFYFWLDWIATLSLILEVWCACQIA